MLLWVRTLGLAFRGPSKLRGRGSSWPKVWALGLAFGYFTLRLAEGSNHYILLVILAHLFGPASRGALGACPIWPGEAAPSLGRPYTN